MNGCQAIRCRIPNGHPILVQFGLLNIAETNKRKTLDPDGVQAVAAVKEKIWFCKDR